jgi:hypothetical protein
MENKEDGIEIFNVPIVNGNSLWHYITLNVAL